jgi:RHS repeat-associated protein
MQILLASPYRIRQKRHRRRKIVSVRQHYNYFRDYEAGTGRYVQSDPIGLNGGVSTYGYAVSSPLTVIDKLGLAPGDLFGTHEAARSDANSFVDSAYGGWFRRFLFGQPIIFVTKVNECPDLYSYSLIEPAEGLPPGVAIRGAAVGGVISGYTRHGLNQAISREGFGVSARSILNAVRSPVATTASRGGSTVYRGADGTRVVVNANGRVITVTGVPRGP